MLANMIDSRRDQEPGILLIPAFYAWKQDGFSPSFTFGTSLSELHTGKWQGRGSCESVSVPP